MEEEKVSCGELGGWENVSGSVVVYGSCKVALCLWHLAKKF